MFPEGKTEGKTLPAHHRRVAAITTVIAVVGTLALFYGVELFFIFGQHHWERRLVF